MTLVETARIVDRARELGRAAFAFNIVTLDFAIAVVQAAERSGAAVIAQISQNAVAFHDGRERPVVAAVREVAAAAGVPISLHLDHADDPALIGRAAASGFSSVMIDYGRLPYRDNVDLTGDLTRSAQRAGLWVEAELGYVGGKPDAPQDAHAPGVRTDPDEAAAFVAATGVDALAVAVGSSHAMSTRSARLDHALIAALARAVPVPLVLHGSSGVAPDVLAEAVRQGIRKINVGTALNRAYTRGLRASLDEHPGDDIRPHVRRARAEVAAVTADLLDQVGAGGLRSVG